MYLSRAFSAAVMAGVVAGAYEPCGNATLPLSPNQPNVLIIGDSISMTPPYTPGGYGGALEALLATKGVYAQHAGGEYKGGQGFSTLRGLNCTNATQPGTYFNPPPSRPFDLIYFNYGLHDADNRTSEEVPLAQYGPNIAEIYGRLRSFAKRVMWRTSTPVGWQMSDTGLTFGRTLAYNSAANASLAAAAGARGFLVHDLWTQMVGVCGWNYSWAPAPCALQLNGTRPNGVWTGNPHLSAAGISFAANSGFEAIMAALQVSVQEQ